MNDPTGFPNPKPTAPNSSFSQVMPNLQTAHDSTSIKAGEKCWRYYKYSNIDGYRTGTANPHQYFGQTLHSAIETYDRACAQGDDHQTAMQRALWTALDESWDHDHNRPWASEEPTKTRDTLLRTLVWYLDQWQNDPLKTLVLENGKPAVELSFRVDLSSAAPDNRFFAPTGEPYLICGHIDRAVEWNSEIWITDVKTTKYALDNNYFKQFSPDTQVSLYSLAGKVIFGKEIAGLIIDGIQVIVTGSRFRRQPIPRTESQLEEWLDDFTIYLRDLERNVDQDRWPMNPSACGFGNFQCVYRPVCSAAPEARQDLLDAFYVKRQWDPLIPR